MKFDIVGKNGLEITEAMKNHAIQKKERFNEFFDNKENMDCRMVCKVYNDHHKVETTLNVKGQILRAEVTDSDMYIAIDHSVEKIVQQIKKHFGQVKSKLAKEGIKDAFKEDIDIEDLEKEVLAKQLVRNKKIELAPMSVDEAIDQMEMLGHDFFVFLNNETSKVNIVYLREDLDYSIIETN